VGGWTEKGECVKGQREGGRIELSVDLKWTNCMLLRDVMCYISSSLSQTIPIVFCHCEIQTPLVNEVLNQSFDCTMSPRNIHGLTSLYPGVCSDIVSGGG